MTKSKSVSQQVGKPEESDSVTHSLTGPLSLPAVSSAEGQSPQSTHQSSQRLDGLNAEAGRSSPGVAPHNSAAPGFSVLLDEREAFEKLEIWFLTNHRRLAREQIPDAIFCLAGERDWIAWDGQCYVPAGALKEAIG
jgi:hypothetical protein